MVEVKGVQGEILGRGKGIYNGEGLTGEGKRGLALKRIGRGVSVMRVARKGLEGWEGCKKRD